MLCAKKPSPAHPPKLKLPSLSSDFKETVQTSVESKPPELGNTTQCAEPEKLLVQETPPKLLSLPPDF